MIFHHKSHIWYNSGSRVMAQNAVSRIKLQDSLQWNISRKNCMNLLFGMQINIEVFYKLILSFWLGVIRHVQSTQNNFSYLCNNPRKDNIFCLQLNTSILYNLKVPPWLCCSGMTKVSKTNLQYLCNILKKMWRIKWIFCLLINDFLKVISF